MRTLFVRAPAARHGHLTATHNGDALFRGLPSVFTAVRYQSLCAREMLPFRLEATTWAEDEDGVVMALRHWDPPLWGCAVPPGVGGGRVRRRAGGQLRELTREHQRATGRASLGVPVRWVGRRAEGDMSLASPARPSAMGRPDEG